MIAAVGRFDETIELQAQMLALEPQAMFVSREQQWNLYAAGRFEEAEAEYQRSQTLAGSHFSSDLAALLRGLARPDADPQTLRELFQRLRSETDRCRAAQHDLAAAIPNRQECWRFSERLSRRERKSIPLRMRWETGTSR